MHLLLDTPLLLWALGNPDRLDREMRGLLDDSGNKILFSAASIWEIAIKSRLRRADLPARPGVAARVADLPPCSELVKPVG